MTLSRDNEKIKKLTFVPCDMVHTNEKEKDFFSHSHVNCHVDTCWIKKTHQFQNIYNNWLYGYTLTFFRHFSKADNFCDFRRETTTFPSLDNIALPKEDLLSFLGTN